MDSSQRRRHNSWRLASSELETVIRALDLEAYDRFASCFESLGSGRIFFSGQGRSGLAAEMAAMRFMHLGMPAHFVGEATAPSVRAGDTLVIVSGSGKTPVSVEFAQIANSVRATVLLVTHQAQSPLRSIANCSIVLPAAASRQFGGTLFEQSALLLLDSVVRSLMDALPMSAASMSYNHTNLQ